MTAGILRNGHEEKDYVANESFAQDMILGKRCSCDGGMKAAKIAHRINDGNQQPRQLHSSQCRIRRRGQLQKRICDRHHVVLPLGFLTSLNDILIPHFKDIFGLSYAQVADSSGFLLCIRHFGFPAGKVVGWIGYQRTMVMGLFAMALGGCSSSRQPICRRLYYFSLELIIRCGHVGAQVARTRMLLCLVRPRLRRPPQYFAAFNSLGTTIGPPLGGYLTLHGDEMVPTPRPSAL